MEKSDLKLGEVYQHYKGKKYKLHNIVRHSETLEELVVYECLYENELGQFWVRPKGMFFEIVVVDGETLPRFKHLGAAVN